MSSLQVAVSFDAYIILRNVGFNAAINIEMLFAIDGMKSGSCSDLDYLPPNEYEAVKVVVEYYKQEITKIFTNIQYKKEGAIIHAFFAKAYSNLRKEYHDKLNLLLETMVALQLSIKMFMETNTTIIMDYLSGWSD